MEQTLERLSLGQAATVTQINTDRHLKNRLQDFGFVTGTIVRCRYYSPGRHIMALELRGSVLALRCADLKMIWGVVGG